MIVYFSDRQKTKAEQILNSQGVLLWQKSSSAGTIDVWNTAEGNHLEKIDALILEITEPDSQINYLLAQAILLQKSTLCFFKKNNPPRQLLTHLRKKNVPHCIAAKSYVDNNLADVIIAFIKTLKPTVELSNIPNIKYTLRMTEALENYLNWKAKQTKINKADFIRDNLKKMMEEDEEYRKR